MSPVSGPEVPFSTSPRARSSQASLFKLFLFCLRMTQNDQTMFSAGWQTTIYGVENFKENTETKITSKKTCSNLIHSDFPGAPTLPTFFMWMGELPGSLAAVSPANELLNWLWLG